MAVGAGVRVRGVMVVRDGALRSRGPMAVGASVRVRGVMAVGVGAVRSRGAMAVRDGTLRSHGAMAVGVGAVRVRGVMAVGVGAVRVRGAMAVGVGAVRVRGVMVVGVGALRSRGPMVVWGGPVRKSGPMAVEPDRAESAAGRPNGARLAGERPAVPPGPPRVAGGAAASRQSVGNLPDRGVPALSAAARCILTMLPRPPAPDGHSLLLPGLNLPVGRPVRPERPFLAVAEAQTLPPLPSVPRFPSSFHPSAARPSFPAPSTAPAAGPSLPAPLPVLSARPFFYAPPPGSARGLPASRAPLPHLRTFPARSPLRTSGEGSNSPRSRTVHRKHRADFPSCLGPAPLRSTASSPCGTPRASRRST